MEQGTRTLIVISTKTIWIFSLDQTALHVVVPCCDNKNPDLYEIYDYAAHLHA